ncbi:MAG: AI-2E family transporter [Acidaminobacteraceae bacterium]
MNRVKKIPYITVLPVLLIAMVSYKLIDRLSTVNEVIGLVMNILVPFFWAFGIAFVANPILKRIEKIFKLPRNISIVLTFMFIGGFITLIVMFILPSIVESINDIFKNIPDYANAIDSFLIENNIDISKIEQLNFFSEWDFTNIDSIVNKLSKYFNVFSNVLFGVLSITTGVFKIFVGAVISIYILKDKEGFKLSLKKSAYAHLRKDSADKAVEFGREANDVFSKFLIGKTLDSFIIAIIAYIGFTIIGTNYPILMAIIIGITNMIPYFGPFFGGIPVTIIVLFYNPIIALYTGIYIIILQQVDGYIIGPKILGDSVGVTPFWIILAILIGGGLFGLLGMLLGVPTFALIRNVYIRYVNKRLKEKDIEIKI